MNLIKFFAPTLMLAALPFSMIAQPVAKPTPEVTYSVARMKGWQTLTAADKYLSLRESFSIALPSQPDSVKIETPETSKGELAGGAFLKWKFDQGSINISHYFFTALSVKTDDEFTRFFNGVKGGLADVRKDKFIAESDLKLGDFRGREFRFQMASGGVMINRSFVSGAETYSLTAAYYPQREGEEADVLRVLNSFKIIPVGEKLLTQAYLISTATPKDLPQTPVVKRPGSDAADDMLKGKVSSVLRERQNIWNGKPLPLKVKSFEYFYDATGSRIKEIDYDFYGEPETVMVYGYLDNKRVSRLADLDSNRRTFLPTFFGEGEMPVEPDTRYTIKYALRFDEQGRVTEEKELTNVGKQKARFVYFYTATTREQVSYDSSDVMVTKLLMTFDAQGNVGSRKLTIYDNGKPVESTGTIKYDEFDKQGNWTKRTVTALSTGNDDSYIEYRTITYHP